ncbi:hypothetical protein ACLB2K_057465 [Fragaria x ananassa]
MAPDASEALAAREIVQQFLNAACTGNVDLLKKLAGKLDEGKGLPKTVADIKDANKRGALHFAAREGQTEMCKYLLEELKLDVDTKDEDGDTPLIHAARLGHTDTAKLLLEYGANPSIASDLGATALHHSAGLGNIELLRCLISKGVDINSQSDAGSPLIWAAGHDQPDAVKILLEHQANLTSSIFISVGVGPEPHVDAVDVKSVRTNRKSPDVLVVFELDQADGAVFAPEAGFGGVEGERDGGEDVEGVEGGGVVGRGVEVADGGGEVGAAVTAAPVAGESDERGDDVAGEEAGPNAESDDDITPLLSAVAAGSLACLELLIQAGAKVNMSAGGATPLHIAADIGSLEIIKCLLKAGADPNVTDEEGLKPIQIAAASGNRSVVEVLFPLTSQVETISKWTVDGILEYMQSETSKQQEQSRNTKELTVPKDSTSLKKELPEVTPEAKKRAAEAKSRGDAFSRKDYQAAVDAYTQAIDMDPTDPIFLSNRSLCWLRLGQPEHALADAKACRELKPDWPKACFREGAALRLMQASNCFYEGVQLDPESKELVDAFREAVEAGRQFHSKDKQKPKP